MNKSFYPKFAATNLKKNSKTYVPYILSCSGTIAMCYMMSMLARNSSLQYIYGADILKTIFNLGTWVISIFAVIFIFYTNSFLVKRRKKEFGLFNILGMEKRHISAIVFFETLYSAVISFIAGIGGGILLSKLILLALTKTLGFGTTLNFEVPAISVTGTLILFGIIFLLTLLNTIRQIHLANPIQLLSGGKVGEKEPKTKLIMTILGIACIAVGYYIAITTEDPVNALVMFFVAVILVILGTYFIFIAGSIALFKILRKNKGYYYKAKHFISVSGMMYRMKQNAVGLASICILSTMVLIMVAGTVSLYIGTEDAFKTRYPRNIAVTSYNITDDDITKINEEISKVTDENHVDENNIIYYSYVAFSAYLNGSTFSDGMSGYNSNASIISIIPLEDYNRMENQSVTLEANEILLYQGKGSLQGDTVQFGSLEYNIKSRLDSLSIDGAESAMLRESYYIIVPDSATAREIYLETVTPEMLSELGDMSPLNYYYAFDVDEEIDQGEVVTDINTNLTNLGVHNYAESEAENRAEVYSLYGGLLFLGVFLGLLFIMATVLIIYYKQISEGYDDKERFEIMQKVGMSQQEVKKSIRSQVVTVFFMPLVTAGIHVIASFKMITKLLALLNLTNVPLFTICTIITFLAFTVMYIIVYSLTARQYYKIVSY